MGLLDYRSDWQQVDAAIANMNSMSAHNSTQHTLDPTSRTIYHIVEIFNNSLSDMSTVNYSVPDKVKQAFNKMFKGKNKSAIIADLMTQAIEREEQRLRHAEATRRILERREHAPMVQDEEVCTARESGRP